MVLGVENDLVVVVLPVERDDIDGELGAEDGTGSELGLGAIDDGGDIVHLQKRSILFGSYDCTCVAI